MSRSPVRYSARFAALGVALVMLLSPVAWSNPLPGVMGLFPHVQPVNEGFCQSNPITSCPEIQQYSEATGLVEFDIFGVDFIMGPEGVIYELCTTVQWPGSWSFVSWEPCQGGVGGFEVVGNEGRLCLTWEHCPTIGEAPFLIARVVLHVEGYGEFRFLELPTDYVTLDCPPYEWTDYPFGITAQAGVECAYCYTQCDLSSPRRPRLERHDVSLEATQGEWATDVISGYILGEPGPVDVACSASWLGAELEWTGDTTFDITVTADAGAMLPGTYECWMKAEGACADCARITFTVLPFGQGVEEDPPPPDELPTSWGRIKEQYR